MANYLSHAKQVMALRCLVEGMGVRPTARVVDCHHQTILKLLVAAGSWATRFSDLNLRDLPCRRIEVDEMWSFVYAKEKNVPRALCAAVCRRCLVVGCVLPRHQARPLLENRRSHGGNGHGVYEGSSFSSRRSRPANIGWTPGLPRSGLRSLWL